MFLNIINNNINGVPLLKEDLKNKLIEGANIWGIPDAKNNYIIIGNTHGSVFDSLMTNILDTPSGQLVKVVAWYDNELSYTAQLIRTAEYLNYYEQILGTIPS